MTRRLIVLAFVVAGGCVPAGNASSRGRAASFLARPLHLPRLTAGERCPVSRVPRGVDFSGDYGTAPGLGTGPAFPIISGKVMHLSPAHVFRSKSWAGSKVLWFVLPSYRGHVLIRGARLDGPGRVRFQFGNVPPLTLEIPLHPMAGKPAIPVPNGARYLPSETRIRGPGCYAYQIDGTSFSRVVVFRAAWVPRS